MYYQCITLYFLCYTKHKTHPRSAIRVCNKQFFQTHMKFLQTVKDSIYNPQFYKEIEGQKVSLSMKYFAKLILLVSCFVAIIPFVSGVGLLTWKQDVIANIHTQIIDTFPRELSVHIKNGEISTNVEEPYAIVLPDTLKRDVSHEKIPYPINNLLVINTQKPIETSDFKEYQTLAVLGKNEIGIFSPNAGKVEIQSLDTFHLEYTLDRTSFEVFVDHAWRVLKIIGIVGLILLPFLIFVGLFIGYAIYLLFGALVIWLAAHLTKKSLTYGQSYALGLHLVTLPLLASFVFIFLFHTPFVFTLILFVITFINFKQIETKIGIGTLETDQYDEEKAAPTSDASTIKDAQIEKKK